MNEITSEQYMKLAVEMAIQEVLLSTQGDLEELSIGIGMLGGGGQGPASRWKMIQESLDAYAKDGRPTGGFLEAILENDLMEAMGRADMVNRWAVFAILQYVYNHMPAVCHGSKEKVAHWLKVHADRRTQRQEQAEWKPGQKVAYFPGAGPIELGEFKGWAQRDGKEDRDFAFVLYHLGDTAANTCQEDLRAFDHPMVVAARPFRGMKDLRGILNGTPFEEKIEG